MSTNEPSGVPGASVGYWWAAGAPSGRVPSSAVP